MTITGTNFAPAASVRFGSVSASRVNVDDPFTITATTAPSAAGTVDVVITNPDGLRGTRLGGYTYVVFAGITTVSPIGTGSRRNVPHHHRNESDRSVSAVTFDGSSRHHHRQPARLDHGSDSAGTLRTGGRRRSRSRRNGHSTDGYTYLAGTHHQPHQPAHGPPAGGTTVTITGTNLPTPRPSASGGVPATIVSRTPTSITITTPLHAGRVPAFFRPRRRSRCSPGMDCRSSRVTGAQDPEGFPIPQGDNRFGFEIVTTGTSSFSLQAQGNAGRVDLS